MPATWIKAKFNGKNTDKMSASQKIMIKLNKSV